MSFSRGSHRPSGTFPHAAQVMLISSARGVFSLDPSRQAVSGTGDTRIGRRPDRRRAWGLAPAPGRARFDASYALALLEDDGGAWPRPPGGPCMPDSTLTT